MTSVFVVNSQGLTREKFKRLPLNKIKKQKNLNIHDSRNPFGG